MKLYQDYIFDLYGTLVDIRTDEKKRLLWNKMSLFYGYYGAEYTPAELKTSYDVLVVEKEKNTGDREKDIRYQEKPDKAEAERLYAHESYPEIPIEEVFRELYTARGIEPSEELVIHTGQMFRALSTHHIRLYAGAKELLRQLHEQGRGVLISSDYGVKKPDERFFRILLEKYRIEPENALMIGNDLDSDIAGARRMGMDTFYIHSGISPKTGRPSDADYTMMKMDLRSLCRRLLCDKED